MQVSQSLEPIHLGQKRRLRVFHLLLIPPPLFIMYFSNWEITTVVPCCMFLCAVFYYSFAHALNRHITIDPVRQEVEIEWKQWGWFSFDKCKHSFKEFSAVRYHTYRYGRYDNPIEDHFGLYLVHSIADLWPCGDTALDWSEPMYDRDMAVKVAHLMGLPLLESHDEPWAVQPIFFQTTPASETSS